MFYRKRVEDRPEQLKTRNAFVNTIHNEAGAVCSENIYGKKISMHLSRFEKKHILLEDALNNFRKLCTIMRFFFPRIVCSDPNYVISHRHIIPEALYITFDCLVLLCKIEKIIRLNFIIEYMCICQSVDSPFSFILVISSNKAPLAPK